MDTRQPLRDVLISIVDDLNIILKQIVTIMCVPRDQRIATGRNAEVAQLLALFKAKEKELEEGMNIAIGQAERQKIIEQLKDEVRKRDDCISKIFACFKESEDVLINSIFQANRKLKSIGEANRRKVQPMELIKYSHRISSSNSVAAPLTWQQGDPQRPYPLDVEMCQGWPERVKERCKMEKEFNIMPSMGLGQSSSANIIPPGVFPGQTPPQQHEFFTRPQQGAGIFPPPTQIPSSPMNSSRAQGWMTSPRPPAHPQISPRIQRHVGPGTAAPGTPSQSHSGTCMLMPIRSPFGQAAQNQQLQKTIIPQTCVLKMETTPSVPNSVEVLSSDSSSSSDSDSQ